MKKELLLLGGIVACISLALFFSRFFCPQITYRDVKEVRLYTYDHKTREEIGLTDEEAREAIRLYNRSRYGGEIDAEPCCAGYSVIIDLTDGSSIAVSEGAWDKVIFKGPRGRRHYLTNQALIDYILELVEQYDLPRD